MKILFDENMRDFSGMDLLREMGHQIASIAELAPGSSDSEILHLATQEGMIIVTQDEDFPVMRFRDNLAIPFGVIVIRESKERVSRNDTFLAQKLATVINHIAKNDEMFNAIITVDCPTPYG